MTDLCDLCVKYGTDKVTWGYTPYYFERFADRRNEVRRVLEIGICGFRDIPNNVVGASLFVWRDFFPNAEIYGIDNDARFIFNDQARIHTALADAYDLQQLSGALASWEAEWGVFDFICDDAVHDPVHQITLYNALAPFLAPGGLYAIEDVCPYKVPNGDLTHMIRLLNGWEKVGVVETHKAERLLLIEVAGGHGQPKQRELTEKEEHLIQQALRASGTPERGDDGQ